VLYTDVDVVRHYSPLAPGLVPVANGSKLMGTRD